MGACNSSSTEVFTDDSRHRAYSFHENLVRQRTGRDRFDKIYEVLEEIGHSGLCTIFRIRKREESIGGSSRRLVKGNSLARIRLEGFFARSKGGRKKKNTDGKQVVFALKVINLSLVQ